MTSAELDASIKMIGAASRVQGFLEGSKIGDQIPMGYLSDLKEAIDELTKMASVRAGN